MPFESAHQGWAEDPVSFWESQAGKLSWSRTWSAGLDSEKAPFYQWFRGGFLNAAYNCLDVHVDQGRGEWTALVFDSPPTGTTRSYTYRGLRDEVARFAGALGALQLTQRDRVLVYMPAIPETVIAMLACARLGITHCVVPPVPVPVLRERIDDARPQVILTASSGFDGHEITAYKAVLDSALDQAKHQPRRCVVLQRAPAPCALAPERDTDWAELVSSAAAHHDVVPVESGHALYILYTSGSTAEPKAIVRDTGGYLTALRWAVDNVFGVTAGEVFWTDSHPGWVMGHSFTVYGALLAGSTTVIYEGSPTGTPDASAFPRLISEYGVRVLFTTPMALRRIRRELPPPSPSGNGGSPPLKAVFLASERVEPDLLEWTERTFGCPVIDNWWQTETGWPIASNCLGPGLKPVRPGSVAHPLPGYQVEIVDGDGHPLPAGEQGHIVIRLPLPPGCLRTLWGDDERFVSTYLNNFPGYYDTSDAGYRDTDGYLWIAGRTDDIINVGGDSLSGLDVEQVLATHPAVERCAVVGGPDPFFTEVPVAFIVRKTDATLACASLARELRDMTAVQIGSWAQLSRFVFLGALPHTPSKKIRRSTLRDQLKAGAGSSGTGDLPVIADISLSTSDMRPSSSGLR